MKRVSGEHAQFEKLRKPVNEEQAIVGLASGHWIQSQVEFLQGVRVRSQTLQLLQRLDAVVIASQLHNVHLLEYSIIPFLYSIHCNVSYYWVDFYQGFERSRIHSEEVGTVLKTLHNYEIFSIMQLQKNFTLFLPFPDYFTKIWKEKPIDFKVVGRNLKNPAIWATGSWSYWN